MIKISIAAVLSLLVAGCGGGGSDSVGPQALTERDFAANPTLRLAPGAVGVTSMEPKDAAPAPLVDTGLPGTDEIPFRIAEQTTSTYAIDTADSTIEKVALIKSSGKEQLFVINAAKPRATVTLEPGDYQLVVHSGYTLADANGQTSRAVFLSNNTPTPAPAALQASAVQQRVFANELTKIELLISSKKCFGCSLVFADLSGANLSGAELSYANLHDANLEGADLSSASLRGAILYYANLEDADLSSASLRGANLRGAILTSVKLRGANLSSAKLSAAILSGANLIGANLIGADLRAANLSGADLRDADLRDADLSDAYLIGAKWVDGRVCGKGSIGKCR